MTDRFPLIFDSADKKLKEIPSGDSLSLAGCDIENANSIVADTVSAIAINADSISVSGQSLATVAITNNYDDLDNTPVGFSGNWNDLSNKPIIPASIRQLNDVVDQEPNDKDILQYDSDRGYFSPVALNIDLSEYNIGDLSNVAITGTVTDKFLKFTAGAWRPVKIQYSDVQNTPSAIDYAAIVDTAIQNNGLPALSTQTLDISGSVFGDDSTSLVDAVNSTLPYSPSESSNWAGDAPETVYEALDRIAAALTALGQQA